MAFLVVIHRKKKLIEGLLTFFFSRILFDIITASGKTIQKILGLFFKVLFFGYPVPSFAVKSYFASFLGTTKPVRLPVTPKHGPCTIFMSPRGRNPYGDSIRVIKLSNLCSNVTKNDKNDVF